MPSTMSGVDKKTVLHAYGEVSRRNSMPLTTSDTVDPASSEGVYFTQIACWVERVGSGYEAPQPTA